eukprot:731573_1
MGNYNSCDNTSLQQHWGSDNTQTFMVKGHKNKIFGCDVIMPNTENSNEVWIASCSADGTIMIHEVLMETQEQKRFRHKILASHSKSKSTSSLSSKSLSSIQVSSTRNKKWFSKQNKKLKPFEIETNRLISIPLDSTVCYTLSLHPSARYVSTSIDESLFIFEVDFNAESPLYNEVQIANKYISSARFIDDLHIVFSSGDGNVYIYNFIRQKLIATIAHTIDILCFDHAVWMGQRQLIAVATLDGRILIYDIWDIIENDLLHNAKESVSNAVLVQEMCGHFGGEISCLSLSNDGIFIVVGAEDNTYNIYNASVVNKQIEWVLLNKQIVANDGHVMDIAWSGRTVVVCCDRGNTLYLSRMYDIRESEEAIQLIVNTMMGCNKDVAHAYDKQTNEMQDIMNYCADIILEYVMWIMVQHQMSVDFDDKISCIATCADVNHKAGFIVVGGFSKCLQCFLPLQNLNVI